MALLRDCQISLLNFSIVMIYIVHKMLVLVRNHLNYLKDNIFNYLFKSYHRFLLSEKKIVFSEHIMMENQRPEEENIIKDIRDLFRLKKINFTVIKGIRNLFRLEKETKAIKDRILRDIKNLFELDKEVENYYKPVRVNNFWSNNYILIKLDLV